MLTQRQRRLLRLGRLKGVADRLDITRSSVCARRQHPDFPRPLAELASGPVWDLSEIDHYHHLRHGDTNDPDFFLTHPDPYRRTLERLLRGLPPE